MNLLEIDQLEKRFETRQGFWQNLRFAGGKRAFAAVDRISISIPEGRTVGLVGESGSGKTVTGELITRLQKPTSGAVRFMGKDVHALRGKDLLQFRREVQMIFQDPFESLCPKFTVHQTLLEPLLIHKIGRTSSERDKHIQEAMQWVGLTPPENYLSRYPHELSGGERQRVAIGRALILKPRFIVADEPTSMLDVSVRAGILNLFMDLRRRSNVSMLYISHDFSTVRYLSDEIAVMYLGKLVETGPAGRVIYHPQHPYTRLLVASIPRVRVKVERATEEGIKEEQPATVVTLHEQEQGCRFRSRCPLRMPICDEVDPELVPIEQGHHVACHALHDNAKKEDQVG